MAPDVMDQLCPSCGFLGTARLDDHRLAFTRRSVRTDTGVADVVPADGDSVWGALYDLDEVDMHHIDQKEGAGWAYRRVPVTVRLDDGSATEAVTYTVVDKESADVRPAPDYLDRLIRAAHQRRLPAYYLRELDALPSRLLTLGASEPRRPR